MRLHHALDCTPNLPRLPGNRASGSGKISESMQDGAWGWWWEKQTALAQNGVCTAGPVLILGLAKNGTGVRVRQAHRSFTKFQVARAGAGEFVRTVERFGNSARVVIGRTPPCALPKFLTWCKSAHSRDFTCDPYGAFSLSLSQHPRICIH